MVELIYAAWKVAGLNCNQALDEVPYAWLLRFRTFLWYSEGLGATYRFNERNPGDISAFERMSQ